MYRVERREGMESSLVIGMSIELDGVKREEASSLPPDRGRRTKTRPRKENRIKLTECSSLHSIERERG